MFTDFFLASFHHLAAFGLVAIVAGQLLLLRPGLDKSVATRIASLDLAYGIAAGLILAAGFSRVFFGAKDPDYYLGNLVFWAKIAVFLAIGALSLVPTLRFLTWRRALRANPDWAPSEAEVSSIKRYVHAEAGLIVLLPILGAALARGYGAL